MVSNRCGQIDPEIPFDSIMEFVANRCGAPHFCVGRVLERESCE
jgi:hypothetical protein